MVSFPDSVKTWVDKTDLVDFFTAANLNDDIMDEIIAVEGAAIGGFARGGPLDLYMDADPGFDQVLNSGDTYITYSAANDRIEVAAVGDAAGTVRAIYKTLPSVLQTTPGPTAVIELCLDFTLQTDNVTSGVLSIEAGLMNGVGNFDTDFMGILLDFDGGFSSVTIKMHGSFGATSGGILTGASFGNRYVVKILWNDVPHTLSATLYNQSTGAVVSTATINVTTSTILDADLKDVGVRIIGYDAGDNATVYIHDMFARILRA